MVMTMSEYRRQREQALADLAQRWLAEFWAALNTADPVMHAMRLDRALTTMRDLTWRVRLRR